MSNYFSTVTSYLPSMPSLPTGLSTMGANLTDRVTSTANYYLYPAAQGNPTPVVLSSTNDALKETTAAYQDLLKLLSRLKLHLDRGEDEAVRKLWSQVEGYETLWTKEMTKHLNLCNDGKCLDILLSGPSFSLSREAFKAKVSGCLEVIRDTVADCHGIARDKGEMDIVKLKNLYQDIFGDLVQMEIYLNRGEYALFQHYANCLGGYKRIWTEEMNEHLHLDRDYRLLNKEPDVQEAALLKQKLNRCMAVVYRSM